MEFAETARCGLMTPANVETSMQARPLATSRFALLDIVERIRPLFAPVRREQAVRLATRLKTHRFRLALLGEFKRGKSTLGNALIGAPILPVGVIPTTAVPTLVRHGETPSARVHLRSGETRPIALSEVAAFSTEKENPENARNVASVEATIPADLLRCVDLLDTPGTGSIHRHNTETALAELGEIDAAVVVLAADQPISDAEIEFLAHLRRHVVRFFFVLNRADLVSPADLAESVEFVRAHLIRRGFPDPEIFPLSARNALRRAEDEDFERFRLALERFLREDREEARIGSIRHALARLVSEELFELRLADDAGRLEEQARRRSVALLQEAVERVRARRNDRRAIMKDRFDRLLGSYDDAFAIFKKGTLCEIPQEVAAAGARLLSLPNRDYDRDLRRIVDVHSAERFRAFIDEAARAFAEGLAEIALVVREETEELNQKLYQALGAAFHLATPLRSAEPALPEGARFDFSTIDVRCQLEATTDFLVLRAPRAVARRLLRRRAAGQAELFYERNGGRVRFDLLTRGESHLQRSFAAAVEAEDELASRLKDALSPRHASDDPERRRHIREMTELVEQLTGS
jgi:GTP-binding protein EngB required for normal cell division